MCEIICDSAKNKYICEENDEPMIGRFKEHKELKEAFGSKYSEFVAIYGRRRIGKTFLVRETFGRKFFFQHSGAASEGIKVQLELFRNSLIEYGHRDCPELKTWYAAFDELKYMVQTSGSQGKKVVFLDEVAWMDTSKSHFLQALEFFWNNWASNRTDILLIICASATSWIINKVFKNRGGLHNRITTKIHLYPFTLKECELYSKELGLKLNRYQIVNLYMVMGGIALYWSLLSKRLSSSQNIDALFFNRDAKLQGEYGDLYDSLFKKPEPYKQIVSALGKRLGGMSRQELLDTTGQADNGTFSDRLAELEECGFISKMPLFPKEKKESVYKLIDNYTIFYFKYIKSHCITDGFWIKSGNSQSVRSWSGFAFERVCMQHIPQIKKAIGIAAVSTTEHTWKYIPPAGDKTTKGAQIDLLIDRNDNVLNICEMKWSAGEFEIDKKYEAELRNKANVLLSETKTRKVVHTTVVTTYGVKENMYADTIQSFVTMDDLFE